MAHCKLQSPFDTHLLLAMSQLLLSHHAVRDNAMAPKSIVEKEHAV